MKKSVHTSLLLFFILGVAFFCHSKQLQAQTRDAGLWTSASFETKIIKKLTLAVSQEIRLNENMTEVGTIFSDAGLTYKLSKNFKVGLNYRFIKKREINNLYSTRHRGYIDIKYLKKNKPFEFQFRSRIQDEYSDIGKASDGGIPEYYLRNKLSVSLDLDKAFSPYGAIELFSPLNYQRNIVFDNVRVSAGLSYSISKHHKIDAFYLIQKELNTSEPETEYILGLGYSFSL